MISGANQSTLHISRCDKVIDYIGNDQFSLFRWPHITHMFVIAIQLWKTTHISRLNQI